MSKIKIKTTNLSRRSSKINTFAGEVSFNEECVAEVSPEVAAKLIQREDFLLVESSDEENLPKVDLSVNEGKLKEVTENFIKIREENSVLLQDNVKLKKDKEALIKENISQENKIKELLDRILVLENGTPGISSDKSDKEPKTSTKLEEETSEKTPEEEASKQEQEENELREVLEAKLLAELKSDCEALGFNKEEWKGKNKSDLITYMISKTKESE